MDEHTVSATLQRTAYGLPVWAWVTIAVVVVALLTLLATRRKRQAIITTRLG